MGTAGHVRLCLSSERGQDRAGRSSIASPEAVQSPAGPPAAQPDRARAMERGAIHLSQQTGRRGSSSFPSPVKEGAGVTGHPPSSRRFVRTQRGTHGQGCSCSTRSLPRLPGSEQGDGGTLPPPQTLSQRGPRPPGTILALRSIPPKPEPGHCLCCAALSPQCGHLRRQAAPPGLGQPRRDPQAEEGNAVPFPPARRGLQQLSCRRARGCQAPIAA